MYKAKTTKKNKKVTEVNPKSLTLDINHNKKLEEFEHNEKKVIPQLMEEKDKILDDLKNAKLPFDIKMDKLDRIKQINREIKTINEARQYYYLNNAKYIFAYFEDKKNISQQGVSSSNSTNTSLKSVNHFFNIPSSSSSSSSPTSSCSTPENMKCDISVIDDNVYGRLKNSYIDRYFYNVNKLILNMDSFLYQTDICKYCEKGELIQMEDEGTLMCNQCFCSVPYLFETDKTSYKEPPKEVGFYAYQRINHYKEILSQFQGKETTHIPPIIISQIKSQAKKERIRIEDLTAQKTKEILKKLGYSKYFEHATFINTKFGIVPPIFSQELEEILCNMFCEIQAPYSKACPDNRSNFLNYYYTIFKQCELLNQPTYLSQLKLAMIGDREKIIEQDEIWKKICQDRDWLFIPTVEHLYYCDGMISPLMTKW
jgi:hypothetical protein